MLLPTCWLTIIWPAAGRWWADYYDGRKRFLDRYPPATSRRSGALPK